jgi:hypothetical protein
MSQLPQPLTLVLELGLAIALAPLAAAVVAAVVALRRERSTSPQQRVWRIASLVLASVATAFVVLAARTPVMRIDSVTSALAVARAVRDDRWPASSSLAAAIESMRTRAELRDLAELLTVTTTQSSGDASAALFESGERLRRERAPLGTFEGWALHELPGGRCAAIVYFRPAAPLSDTHLWLHEYAEGAAEYRDVPRAMPPATWQAGELSWQLFEVGRTRRFAMYAGIEQDGALGPAVLLGAVDGCRAIR